MIQRILVAGLSIFVLISLTLPQIEKTGEFTKMNKTDFHPGFPLPDLSNTLFNTAGSCELCHGEGSLGPNALANTDPDGNDISPVSQWQSTMMANSSKDPFFRAKLSHETLENPGIAEDIENVCLKCHAPLGSFNAAHHGLGYTVDSLKNDLIGLDGVSCLACHSMAPEGLGEVFSAEMTYDTNHNVYGQYVDPFPNPMQNDIGFNPMLGEHVSTSEACGACHTLITHPVDYAENPLGTSFVEQAIYHEWLNSEYSQNNTSCQDCHMPKTEFDVYISNRPPWLDKRFDYSQHDLVGGNVFMLNILMNNVDTLGLTASTTDFEITIDKTLDQLQNQSLYTELIIQNETPDSITYELFMENKVGHKLPGGYPSRRLIVEFLIQEQNGDTVFYSGAFNSDYSLVHENADYEPHYDTIRTEDEVQIYEMVMADYLGDVTTVLEYAYESLKDNRLVPAGFSASHNSYDTVAVVGNAESDANFNESQGGVDRLYYKIPKHPGSEQWVVRSKVYYQTLPPKWTEEMFNFSSEEIDLFQYLYDNAEQKPTIIASNQLNGFENTIEQDQFTLNIFPNPSINDVTIQSELEIEYVELLTFSGQLVYTLNVNSRLVKIAKPHANGAYWLRIKASNGQVISKRVVFY